MADAAQALFLHAFGDQALALPDELGGGGVDFFGDATAKGVVAIVMLVQRLAVDVATGVQLVDGVILQSALFVVLVAAYQMDLLEDDFQTMLLSGVW